MRKGSPEEQAPPDLATAVDQPVLVNARQVSRILGGLSQRTVYRYGSHLGMRRFGRAVRFDLEAVHRAAREGLPPSAGDPGGLSGAPETA